MTKVTVLSASIGTQVSKHVGKSPDGDPLWISRFISTAPDAIISTYLDFLRAGAEIIPTFTYQASVQGFMVHLGLTESASLDLMRKSVDLAKEALKTFMAEKKGLTEANRPRISGSCGPYGASLHDASEYSGSYAGSVSKEFLKEWHRPRVEALINGGVDLLEFDTIPCEIEAEAIVELLKDFPGIKAWLSFSCRTDGRSIVDGSDFRKVARKSYRSALPGQIIAVGMNCIAPKVISSFFHDINGGGEEFLPLIVYPNSGETYTAEKGWQWLGDEPKLEDFVQEWLDMGVRFIGGCCRTEDKNLVRIKKEVDEWVKKRGKGDDN